MTKAFDPLKPICPECGLSFKEAHQVDSKRYDADRMTMNIYICPKCNVAVGVIVLDEPDPNDPYIVEQA